MAEDGELVSARPAPALRPLVDLYSGYRMPAAAPGVHMGVAGGHLTFLLCLEGTVDIARMPDPDRSPGSFTSMVGGLHDAPAVITTGAAQTGLQLRLTWLGARVLLGTPASALTGDVVGLDDLIGARADRLRARLAEAPTWRSRFALLDAALSRLAADARRPDPRPEVAYAWHRLTATGGTLRIAELAEEIGWSRRHLALCFRDETGLTPKSAARVIRFERACDLLRTGRTLADTAATCGYADQPHLARDFRDLAGQTATDWLAERRSA
ncbi:helix-turn-helix domain-containing protein [Pseudonocardia oroxyli]|uniref:Transcriptional regulator, AraC family n=1 Tax=Pseudonocardia oroxyli TaxID=366584 RepID=A0A1G7K3H6_PSEOR|nr:helix-turn-helix transcriptional regulator [Pseudonocardia oroxyli]SDF31650.1 transcriptional regulator, AraC family [Pseudonocardia oroxyli]